MQSNSHHPMKRHVAIASLSILIAFLPHFAGCQRMGDPIDDIFANLDGADRPGAAALVIQDGETVYRRGFGQANLEHKIPITPSTVFDIASVSKQFAGMAIAMMVEQGLISLDDDIREYLPYVPDFGYVITIDHLVHHTSGLRDWPGTLRVAGWQSGDVISFDQILTMTKNQRDLNFEPGTEYSYSNTNYNLLAALVESISGKSFRDWTDENIFDPLAMSDTHFHDDHSEIVFDRAQGYEDTDEGLKRISNNLTAIGSSSLYSTVDDLAKWIINFDDGRVGGMAAIERMHQQGVLTGGEQINYAFGQTIGQYRGLNFWSHSGSWAGFRSIIARFPEQRFAVIILSNISSFNPREFALQIVDRYLGEFLEPKPPDRKNTFSGVTLKPSKLDEYTGVYRLGPGRLITISREGNTLVAHETAEGRLPIYAISDREFYVDGSDDEITFVHDDAGKIDQLLYREVRAPKIANDALIPAELSEYAGIYYSDELDTGYRLSVLQGVLVAHHRRHGDIPLSPLLADEFRSDQPFIPAMEFDRDQNNRIDGFRITQSRSRNMQFIRLNGGE